MFIIISYLFIQSKSKNKLFLQVSGQMRTSLYFDNVTSHNILHITTESQDLWSILASRAHLH